MPSFTTQIPDLLNTGPVVDIAVATHPDLLEHLKESGQSIPTPVRALAMIDTGATSTIVKPEIIESLGINPIGEKRISTPSCTDFSCNQYQATILFPNRVAIHISSILEAPLTGQSIQCLIGRDILSRVVFIYNGYANFITFSI